MRRWFAALLSAPLLVIAQSPIGITPVSIIALVPWLWASKRSSSAEALALGSVVGLLYGCFSASWIPEALRSLGSSLPDAFLALLLMSIWMKVPIFACVGWLTRRLRDRSVFVQVFVTAIAFSVGEWIIGRFLFGVPWALVGHSQIRVPGVAQLAVAGGVPLLSGWLVAINAANALILAPGATARRLAAALASGWIVTAVFGLTLAESLRPDSREGTHSTLLLVQPQIPPDARWDPGAQGWILDAIASHTSRALDGRRRHVDAIVWPENLLTQPLESDPTLARAMEHHVGAWKIPLITGLVRPAIERAPGRYRSSIVWIEPDHGIVTSVDKFRAIPLFESGRNFIGASWLIRLLGRTADSPTVEEADDHGRALVGAFSVTPVLCYEILFPEIVASRRTPESLVILNLADESWVNSAAATRQLADFASFRAIEQRIPLIRVTHGGLSRMVNAFGVTQVELPSGGWAEATVEVRDSPPPAMRERLVLLGLPLSTGLGVWCFIGAISRRNRNRE